MIESIKADGDCFSANGNKFIEIAMDGDKIVHGMVDLQGELTGLRSVHCWIERDDMVLDFSEGREMEIPASLYYAKGNIVEEELERYDRERFLEQIVTTKNWGYWSSLLKETYLIK